MKTVEEYVAEFREKLSQEGGVLRVGVHMMERIPSTKEAVEALQDEVAKWGQDLSVAYQSEEESDNVKVYYIGLRRSKPVAMRD